MAKKGNYKSLEDDWEKLSGDSDRMDFIKIRIDSFLKLFEFQDPGSITYSLYDDIDTLIKLTTTSGILAQLNDEYDNKMKKLMKLRKGKPSRISLINIG